MNGSIPIAGASTTLPVRHSLSAGDLSATGARCPSGLSDSDSAQGYALFTEQHAADLVKVITRFRASDDKEETIVDLSRQRFATGSLKTVLLAAAAIKQEPRIQVNLGGSELDDEAIEAVAELIRTQSGKLLVDLREVNLSDKAVNVFRTALLTRNQLVNETRGWRSELTLGLERTGINDARATVIAEALQNVHYPLRLWCCHNAIEGKGGLAIAQALIRRRCTQNDIKVDLWGNKLSRDSVMALKLARRGSTNHVLDPRLYSGYVVGLQYSDAEHYEEFSRQLELLESAGIGTLKKTVEHAVPSLVFDFETDLPDKALRGVVLVVQKIGNGFEDAAFGASLLAHGYYGSTSLKPKAVLLAGSCKHLGERSLTDLYLFRACANAVQGVRVGNEYEPRPMRLWNPQTHQAETVPFVPCHETLVACADKALNTLNKGARSIGMQPLTCVAGTGISSPTVLDGDWRGKVRQGFVAMADRLPREQQFIAADRVSSAAAKVFYESNVPFAAVCTPKTERQADSGALLTGFIWEWVRSIGRVRSLLTPKTEAE